jgi:glycosyltransferase involved in cell wall biosynthesis
LVVGYKQHQDSNVHVIPNHSKSPIVARPLWWLDYKLFHPIRKRVRGTYRLSSAIRSLASPAAISDIWRGIENFNFPGTWHLLDVPPQRPDIVHCHNLHGDYFDLRALPWLSQQVPVVLQLHDAWLLTGHCAHALNCDRWMTGCGDCPDLDIYPAVRQDRTAENWQRKRDIYNRSHLYITAVSEWLMSRVKLSMLHGVQYRVIPNGIDVSLFVPGDRQQARADLNLPQDAHIILLTSHNAFKDFDTMISALERLHSDRPLIFVCLGISKPSVQVGQGTMRYTGIISDKHQMVKYYQAADVYIHAAKQEAFGKTITEAMACGIPVVATAIGGIPEQIEDGITGYLVPARDGAAMAERITSLLTSPPDRLAAMTQAARRVVEARYSLEAQATAFLSWYGEVIDDWKTRNS